GLLRGVVPDLRVLTVSVDPVRLALARPAGWLLTSAAELAPVSASVAVPELATLAAGLRPRLAGGLVRGNSASAMVAALKVLAMAHPELTAAASRLARALLQVPGLRGAGTLADADDAGLQFPGFRRRSCCLYYRVPGGGLCGDCCLARVPAG
ncbi:MAG TPA: (2Fe-2S)-binding protein, partial [Streptosporangiaceae bacterium]|nr:(2Fe-2S)-binding protein [Streptosporangiaceae bacterium]